MKNAAQNANQSLPHKGDKHSDITAVTFMPRMSLQEMSRHEVAMVAGGPETSVATGVVPPR